MCTAIAWQRQRFLFGRNMDIERGFGQQVVLEPKGYLFPFSNREHQAARYAILGMAAVAEDVPLYADAVNEAGLCMAALHFPGNAHYGSEAEQGKRTVAPHELIPLVLGTCATVKEARELLEELSVAARPVSAQLPISFLHWMVSDHTESIAVEPLREGLMVYDNPTGVLTNNPPFPFHAWNWELYRNVTPKQPQGEGTPSLCYGLGGMGLPGDYSSPSRFIKAAFLRQSSSEPSGRDEQIEQFFHLLEAVAPPAGCVLTERGEPHFTAYSCCMDTERFGYFYRTAYNSRLCAIIPPPDQRNGTELAVYPLQTEPDLLFPNGVKK